MARQTDSVPAELETSVFNSGILGVARAIRAAAAGFRLRRRQVSAREARPVRRMERRDVSLEPLEQRALLSGDALSATVDIPDPYLEAVIRRPTNLNKPRGAITVEDMLGLQSLSVLGRGGFVPAAGKIRNLQGLEHAKNLVSIVLPMQHISDLRPLSGLGKLRQLHLSSNRIGDLRPLSGLRRLDDLQLPGNRITNLSALRPLDRLYWLTVSDNRIRDVSPISRLTRLGILNLGNNRISDLRPLARLPKLSRLGLWDNPITDIRPLLKLKGLEALDLSGTRIADHSPLARLHTLEQLYLDNARVRSIGFVRGMPRLNAFTASGNRISDISPLADKTRLEYAELSHNLITDITPLRSMIKPSPFMLTTLIDVRHNRIDFTPGTANWQFIEDFKKHEGTPDYLPQDLIVPAATGQAAG